MAARACTSCAFHVGDGREIYCRFNPPTVVPVFRANPIDHKPQLSGQMSLFPKVMPDWFCGHYETAIEALPEGLLKPAEAVEH